MRFQEWTQERNLLRTIFSFCNETDVNKTWSIFFRQEKFHDLATLLNEAQGYQMKVKEDSVGQWFVPTA
jgi:hypothetical protein